MSWEVTPEYISKWLQDYNILPGPIWPDSCNHPTDSYICSFNYIYRNKIKDIFCDQQVDLYVFKNGKDQELCIRYGVEGHEYISPGKLSDFISRGYEFQNDTLYRTVASILKLSGRLDWTPLEVFKLGLKEHLTELDNLAKSISNVADGKCCEDTR